jgi:hypothetical protein
MIIRHDRLARQQGLESLVCDSARQAISDQSSAAPYRQSG